MISLTKHERLVLWVLLGVLAGGFVLHFVVLRIPQMNGVTHFLNYVSDQSRIDLNTATAEELIAIPGIGPGLAKRILEYRAAQGEFCNPEQLKNISGIGPKKYEAISEHIRIGGK